MHLHTLSTFFFREWLIDIYQLPHTLSGSSIAGKSRIPVCAHLNIWGLFPILVHTTPSDQFHRTCLLPPQSPNARVEPHDVGWREDMAAPQTEPAIALWPNLAAVPKIELTSTPNPTTPWSDPAAKLTDWRFAEPNLGLPPQTSLCCRRTLLAHIKRCHLRSTRIRQLRSRMVRSDEWSPGWFGLRSVLTCIAGVIWSLQLKTDQPNLYLDGIV
jgi:hypothetical protein